MATKFCEGCGKKIAENARECPKCGQVFQKTVIKKRQTAILLAVFLGHWTWVYTYKQDAVIFWISILLSIATLGFFSIVSWIASIIIAAVRNDEWYEDY